jgi:hypothetical protein
MKMPIHKIIKAMVMEEINIKRMKTLKKNVSTDGNNGNGDKNDGGGEEVGAEDGE